MRHDTRDVDRTVVDPIEPKKSSNQINPAESIWITWFNDECTLVWQDSSYALNLAPDFRLGNKYKVDRRITRDSKRDLQVAGIVQVGLAVIDDKTGLVWTG